MREPGQLVLVPFAFSDQSGLKLRPALLICRAPGRHDDWLLCMLSSRLHQAEPGFDEIVASQDPDFAATGLKVPSVIRLARVAVVDGGMLAGAIGSVGPDRLRKVRMRLADWIAVAE